MSMSLNELYDSHTGKVSDKWEYYLGFYDRVLFSYKDEAIKILEIGVQNGGSLEIWSRFFPYAEKIVGCDIDSNCSLLNFEDKRIDLIVGDICDPKTLKEVNENFESFDIIIDDGSHISSEIIKTFCNLFPKLADGGSYIIEDLHCSYWDRYQGGLYYPESSLFFFKKFIDIINKEHWGVNKSTVEFLNVFSDELKGLDVDKLAETIDFIEFANSTCMIKKKPLSNKIKGIGKRIIVGEQASVRPDAKTFRNQNIDTPDESANIWSNLNFSIEEDWEKLRIKLSNTLRILEAREDEIRQLRSTASWKITAPIRYLKAVLVPDLISNVRLKFDGYKSLNLPRLGTEKQLPQTAYDKYQFENLISKKVCIFAHYSSENTVSEHVIYYLRSLKEHDFDIVFVSTSQLCTNERDKLKEICNYLLVRPNIGYDFGSWQIGLSFLKEHDFIPDQILIANDSVYGPFTNLDAIFARFKHSSANVFGLTDSYEIDFHLQSYFILFDNSVIRSKTWENFWNNIGIYHSKKELVVNCEVRLSMCLMEAGFELESYCRSSDIAHQAITKGHAYRHFLMKTRAYNVTHLLWDILIVDFNFPFIKRELIEKNPLSVKTLPKLKGVLINTSYPIHLIDDIKK